MDEIRLDHLVVPESKDVLKTNPKITMIAVSHRDAGVF